MNCPNCGSSAQVRSRWESGNGTRLNAEYICGCGCHWVDRYDFWRRDVIYQGATLHTNQPTANQINATFKNQQFQD
jgi:hypothetical protein